jgi:lipoprotein-anchoring transpeptidase ErfK/SrfK
MRSAGVARRDRARVARVARVEHERVLAVDEIVRCVDRARTTMIGAMQVRTRLLIGLALLIPAVPIVIAVVLITSGSGNAADHGIGSGSYTPVTIADSAPGALAKLPPFASTSGGLPPGSGAIVAQLTKQTVLRSKPGGAKIGTLGLKTQFDSRTVVLVDRLSGNWLGIVSPVVGNGRIGWIPRSAATLKRVHYELKVSLSQRHVTVLFRGRQVERYLIAVGMPSAPTPTGNFAVTDQLSTHDPTGPYGCCILALSALAPHAIADWSGGNRIAIHSTPETSSIGHNVSHGCMRLTLPEGQWLIDHIPLGTPVMIRE